METNGEVGKEVIAITGAIGLRKDAHRKPRDSQGRYTACDLKIPSLGGERIGDRKAKRWCHSRNDTDSKVKIGRNHKQRILLEPQRRNRLNLASSFG
ncbi:hypothetical protein SUGI_0492370 [Cryptomeria japonica]|nr:hypothetical protein SUGI_0492370 [Cryptomeria japonica]